MSTPTTQQATAHTPGPWKVECGSTPDDFIVTEPTGRTICEPNDPIFDNDICEIDAKYRRISLAEAQANARLIAAAPEMLEALKAITEQAQSWHDFHHGSEIVQCDEICACLKQCNAAIAKAQGETR